MHFPNTWLRRTLAWSNAPQAWRERVSVGACLAGAGLLWWLADRLSGRQQLVFWGLWCLLVAVLLKSGWYTFLGPVCYYDLVRTTRRSRFALYRVYAYFLIILLAIFYSAWHYRSPTSLSVHKDTIAFANTFFYTFMSLQFVAALLLTPAYTAGVITGEKERRTLEYLLATDLRNRELILSPLASRLANLLLMLLTGLPVMSFVEFCGGVSPGLVLVGFAGTAVTMVSLASLSVLCSVYARRTRAAILYAYMLAAVYLLLSGLSRFLYTTPIVTWSWRIAGVQVSVSDLLDCLEAGNPVVHFLEVSNGLVRGGRLADSLPVQLREYALFHGVASVLCVFQAVAGLRRAFHKQAEQPTLSRRQEPRWWNRPRVGRHPMVWKELWIEGGLRFRWLGRMLLLVFVLASFWPFIHYVWFALASGYQTTASANFWSRTMGAMVGCLLLVGVAVRAATAISSERERDTLDGLLTTPLDSTSILWSKWLGSIWSIRWGCLWVSLIWVIGIYVGGLRLGNVALLYVALFIYASTLAMIGLWFSVKCRNSQRAVVWTLLATGALGVGFLVLPVDFLFLSAAGQPNEFAVWLSKLELALTPPVVLGRLLPLTPDPKLGLMLIKEPWEIPMAILGLSTWAFCAVVLWILTCRRFRRLTCRETVRSPESIAPLETTTPGKSGHQLATP
jgi:ABC-type transport system involved in multi-copper enzyme maturation permease subunit